MTGAAGRHDAAATPDPSRMHPDVAGNWALWSRIVGPSAQARLQQLEERFPELTTAVLGTAATSRRWASTRTAASSSPR